MNQNQTIKKNFYSKPLLLLFSLMLSLLTAVNTNAATITVSSVAALQTAINNSSSGDVLILANGTYLNNTLSISKSNITVKAATSGGVYLNGTNDITISGSHVVFSGFQFTSGNIDTGTVLEINGSYNVITQLNFSDYYAAKYIHINDGTQYNEITFCNIEKKPATAAIGCTIQISTSPTVPGYHKIRYCSFQNYFGLGGDNGNEPIRIGLGAEYLNKSRTIIENCYFNNTGLGDSETISVKCQENIIRYCTFTNQQNAMLVFRNGDNNVAYSNFFINAGGIRVKEANNIYCYNNYFENSGVGSSADAVSYIYVAPLIPPTTASPRTLNLDNINFIHNTFYNCGNIDLGGTGATNNTWANNIFKKSSGSIFTNANSGTTWSGNIRSGSLGITIATGMTNVDPILGLNSDGYYGIGSNSPAINAASSSYPSILDITNLDDDPTLVSDVSGQSRVGIKDIGADEYATSTISNRPLAVTEVGPNFLGGPSIEVSTQPTASSICSGSNTSFTASSTSTLSPTTIQWQRSVNSGSTWTNITSNLDAGTTYSGFTTETLVLTGSSSVINNYQYKAVFTNTIGSLDSNAVTLTVKTTPVPTGSATRSICGTATIASLTGYSGTALKWYTSSTGGTELLSTASLTSGNYYVSQTLNSCESIRLTVAVSITSPAPTAPSSPLLLCSGSTVADLTATGSSLKWYAAASGGSQLSSGTTISTMTYYVSQTISSCESSRTPVVVEVYVPASLPVLNADGPGNTYELITSVLAPCQGVSAVESPDMLDATVIGTHPSFGRHIAEVMDADLGKYVFEFYAHVAEDNDVTGGLDRERVEIKTYGGSTDNLKGVLGETVTYKWRFKVPTGFKPSNNFTHIHQIKAVDGDDSSPLFTLTPRYGTPNTLQLLYVADSNSSADTRAEVNLSLFENTWVEAVETIKIGTGSTGTYAITLKKVIDGTTLLSYSSNAIQTLRTAATDPASTGKVANSFIRPKWGIYRSLLDSGKLRDETMRFSDISISEIVPPTAGIISNSNGTASVSGVAGNGVTVTVKFPDNTTATAVAGESGVYGPITSGLLQTSGNIVVTYVSNGNISPETLIQFTALPVVSDQIFCKSGTVANLSATGTLIKWYAAASGGSVLATSTALTTGNYYVTQTVNGLESERKLVLITINTTNAPLASSQSLCGSVTVANLLATGTDLKWYTVQTGGTALNSNASLASGTYYVSQTLNSCESTRTSVAVTLNTTAAPTASAQSICNSGTVANLTATGTALKWYSASTGGTALASNTALASGTYYVSQTLNSCESSRVSSVVTISSCTNLKIILKLDDFNVLAGSSTSTPTLDYLVTKQIKAGIGCVANRNDATALSVFSSYLNQTNLNGDKLFEVWHHGFDHISPEFEGTTYAYQKSHFEDANQLILDGLRVQMRSFGAPFNANDATTNTVISENSNYKVTMFQNPAPNASTGILNLTNRVNMESATGVPSYSTFITNYNFYKSTYTDYMVLQGHPYAWTTPEKLAEFSQIIDFLIAEGAQFVTPFDYYLSLNPSYSIPTAAQTISFPALPAKLKGESDFSPGATSTSGLPVTYNSSNTAVATIVNGNIHIIGSGTTIITASQMGNTTFKSANYVSQTLTVTSREFRSLATGNWNTPGTWQINDNSGNWTTSTTLIPTSENNVYIQSGHTITVNTAEANCYDLHINPASVLAISSSFNVNVNGKIRAFSGSAVTSSVGGGYAGTSTTSLVNTMITTGSTGVLKFVGGTRTIFNTGEWNGSGTTNNVTFALDSGAIGTIQTAIKFRVLVFASGTISTVNTINVGNVSGNGIMTINSGAKLVSSRTYISAGSQVITYSSSAKTGTITINSGGFLELLGVNPVIDCTSFVNNGTVIYSGAAQTLLTVGAGSGTPITTYTNLTISGTGAKTIPLNTNISVNGTLSFAASAINIVTGTNILSLGTSANISGAGTGWVVGNLNKLTALGSSPTFAYAIGDATNYTPLVLTFSGVTSTTGGLTTRVNTSDHLQIATSGLSSTKSVNKNWTLTNDGLAGFGTYDAVFGYSNSDDDSGTIPSNFQVRLYNGSVWSSLSRSGIPTDTSITATGISNFGDFAIGECVITTTEGSVTTSICSGASYTWPANGQTYTTAQNGTTFVSGCNTATLNLTITEPTTTGSETISQCGGSYTWPVNNVTYSASTTEVVTEGCNTATLNLTITPATTTGSETISQCGGSYTWPVNNVTYTASTTEVVTVGCNTATLNLTITPATTTGSETISQCGGSYTWPVNNVTYSASTTEVVTEGCNTATLNLTINQLTTEGSVTTSINAGESYTWPANGQTYTTAQNGTTFVSGCNTATLNLTVITTQIPSGPLSLCKGATVASVTGTTSLKFYAASTGGTALVATTAFATKTYYVTETISGVESTPRTAISVTVNNLPATPSALVSSESLVICKYIGSSTPVTFNATAANAVSYIWNVPSGASIVSGDGTASIGVSFAGASTTAGAIGSVTVQIQDANNCVSLSKALALTTKVPTAPTALTMKSADSTPSFKGIITPATESTPAVYGLVGLNTLASITKVGPYVGTSTVFTLTAPAASTAASYLWTLPEGVNQLSGGTSNEITVNFAGVTPGTTALPISVQSVGGCGNSTNRTLSLARVIPTAPTALVLTNSSQANLSSLAKITKVGPYTGTPIAFTLTATPFTTQGSEATSYAWILPSGVNCISANTPTTVLQKVSVPTAENPLATEMQPFVAISTPTNTITVNFSGVTGTGNLDLKVFGINGAGNSIARTLTLARALPTAPTKLVLTDDAISLTTAVTKAGPYTAKETPLTLTVTPFTTQGAEATSYSWVLPAGVNVTAGASLSIDNGTTKTWTGTASVLTINLAGIGIGVTSIPMHVYAVNGAGTSTTARTLTLTSAAPATPGSITTPALGVPTFNPTCNSGIITVQVPNVYGADYTWTLGSGATIISGQGTNSIVVNVENVTTTTLSIGVVGSNGTGNSALKVLVIKKVSTCRTAVESIVDEFGVIAYPNPSASEFTIESSSKGATTVQVYDMMGRLIENAQANVNSVQVGRNYAAGTYNVIVSQGAKAKTLKVIKK